MTRVSRIMFWLCCIMRCWTKILLAQRRLCLISSPPLIKVITDQYGIYSAYHLIANTFVPAIHKHMDKKYSF